MKGLAVRVAVIVDLVGSRRHADRAWVHRSMLEAQATTNRLVPHDQPMTPTLGDESQARYLTLLDALNATLVLRLALPETMDCRAGIGIGSVEELGTGVAGPVQDGPAWWSARDAIVEAKAREAGRTPGLRTWYQLADEPAVPVAAHPSVNLVNAFLLMRDEVVTQMSPRSRRLLLGLVQGRSQQEMAAAEGISQSAVSQNLRRSGAVAVLASSDVLAGWGAPQ